MRRRLVDRERAQRRATEARTLAVELRHDGADRQRAGRRIARAGEKTKRRLALRGEDERRQRRVDDEPRGDAVERRRALVGHQAQVADDGRHGERRRAADLAAAFEAIEDAAADLAPRLIDARAALQSHRRDVRAGVEAQVDVDERHDAAEIEMQRALRRGVRAAPRPRVRDSARP